MYNTSDVTRRNLPGEVRRYGGERYLHSGSTLIVTTRELPPQPPPPPAGATVRTAKHRLSLYDDHTSTCHYLVNCLLVAPPFKLRRALRVHRRCIAIAAAALLLLLIFVFFDYVFDIVVAYNTLPLTTASSADVWGVEEFDVHTGALAVLVQHDGAMERLNVTPSQTCAVLSTLCSSAIRLSPQLLPSWTLRVVEPRCAECTDTHGFAAAVKGVTLVAEHAVFATSAAPLGRIGPMLLAMSSVTDDVDVATELPQWGWLRHVYPNFPAALRSQPPRRRPYLAVMGVPSTDQPARLALRDAQRATWMSYHEVARNENAFEGALLPLYVVAAAEPEGHSADTDFPSPTTPAAAAAHASTKQPSLTTMATTTLNAYPYVNASSVAPTVKEFEAATQARTALAGNVDSVPYTHRSVKLRQGWTAAAAADHNVHNSLTCSPCGTLATRTVDEGKSPSALTTLATTLGLSVTPAFVAGAQFICHASASLWREALEHRNVIWVDMMTDRRPTTDKRFLGEPGQGGLAAEVGMSQKLILWLEYAYHAFPDVPYIMKGDDDTYLKVPQLMSDVRRIMSDAMSLPNHTDVSSYLHIPFHEAATPSLVAKHQLTHRREHRAEHQQDGVAPPPPPSDAPCFYWGSLRLHKSTCYAAGMNFLLHRGMAHAVLAPSLRRRGVDVVRLATHTYRSTNTRAYRKTMFHREDVLLGLLLNASMPQAERFCAHGRVFFVKEGIARFRDLHRGTVPDVTWSTVVAHRCTPADYYYLHYFFSNEYRYSQVDVASRGATAEASARRHVRDRMMEQRKKLPLNAMGGDEGGGGDWDALPSVRWTHHTRVSPSYAVDNADRVAVYDTKMRRAQDLLTRVSYGYYTEPVS
ncbi:unspecified product [Leptomonas pyrrhocoris]|uniref:Unspecified product n=1 Tax=Leptomonas pyrrhocoris TaxID=157538 RepID=A0A0M9FS76_LEPPY|nr:unspecified product [Leptomonas pyrrhocoris]KPA74859.1 unspecified product [Leptomonas pyrrhocoris]|eukprot:XP_015653298.1 unspecified product [Leptomonas pyrrhocoris]